MTVGVAGPELEPDSGLACLALISHFLGQAADPADMRHQLGRAGGFADIDDLVRLARRRDFKARIYKAAWPRLKALQLPAIAEMQDGSFTVLAKVGGDMALVHDAATGRPQTMPSAEFEQAWSGRLVLVTSRARLAGERRAFDISWFIPAIIHYRTLFGEVLLASFFLQLFALISPLFFQVVIDKVLVHRGLTTLDVLVVGLVAVSIFEAVLGGLRTYLFSHTTNRVDVELGAGLFRHLLQLPLGYFESRRVGDSVARVRELENIRNFLTGSALTVLIDVFFTFVFLGVMYYYSPTLTYIVLGSIPFYVVLSIAVTPILRRRLDEKFRRGAENQAFLVESVSAVETVKAMAVEPQMQRRWEEQLAAYVGASFRAGNLGNIANQSAGLINKIVTALTLWFGAHMVMDGSLTIGQLVAFNMLAGRVSGPVLRLAQLWQDYQQFRISMDRLGDILNQEPEPTNGGRRARLPAMEGNVRFDHVSFRYRADTKEVLADVDLDIKAGEVVGIVGSSGSGKSTLTKLLQRLYQPERGRVLVDGVDLAMVDPAWLRRQVGVVLQENILFNRSVRDNIALSEPGMAMDQVIAAAKLAGAHDFILELPEGYDTVIGERGTTLSGGQRQRMAIARALSTAPKVLIFDEATSALDYESERQIQDNMRAICQSRTVLIVAHRLAAVRDADRIITIEGGRVVEQGTHHELIAQAGRYATLHRHQSGDSDVA